MRIRNVKMDVVVQGYKMRMNRAARSKEVQLAEK